MNKAVIMIFLMIACFFAACNKNNVPTVSGTIDGQPAITLYGSSHDPSDYIFLSTAMKAISYNGQVVPYFYSSAQNIFMVMNGSTIAKATLDTTTPPTVLTFTATYGFTFASSIYTAK